MSESYLLDWLPMESSLEADTASSTLRGVQVAMRGEAKGHGFELDEETLDQIVVLGNAAPKGIKARFGHPTECAPGLGQFLGVRKNFRRDGHYVKADLHMSAAARPENAKHVMDMARLHPEKIGNSIVVSGEQLYRKDEKGARLRDESGKELLPVLRVKHLHAVDVVDEPAAGDGMFAEPIPGISLSPREVIRARDLLDNPDFLGRALDVVQARAEALGLATSTKEPPTTAKQALSEKDKVLFILDTCRGCAPLSEPTKEFPRGLERAALESDMDHVSFLTAALDVLKKRYALQELEIASLEVNVPAAPVFEGGGDFGPVPNQSLEEGYFARFRALGYSETTAREMAQQAAKG